MPLKDGTGPKGKGPLTGRGLGGCAKPGTTRRSTGRGIGKGQGLGRGQGGAGRGTRGR